MWYRGKCVTEICKHWIFSIWGCPKVTTWTSFAQLYFIVRSCTQKVSIAPSIECLVIIMDNLLFLFSFWLLRKYMLYYGRQNNKTLMYHWTIHAKVMLLEKQIFYPVPNALSLISNLTILRFVLKTNLQPSSQCFITYQQSDHITICLGTFL